MRHLNWYLAAFHEHWVGDGDVGGFMSSYLFEITIFSFQDFDSSIIDQQKQEMKTKRKLTHMVKGERGLGFASA